MTKLGLLHTVEALPASFDAMLEDTDAEIIHVVDPTLLAGAIDHGVDDRIRADVLGHIRGLVEDGAEAILVTCSSIGEAVEEAAAQVDVPVLRVDAPMAKQAVQIATEGSGSRPRIAVLATLEATLGPTGRLLERAVAAADADVEVTSRVVEGAVAARTAGDQARHDALVRDAIASAAADAAVVVLAQASMAAAADGLELTVPVLTSPASGVAAFKAVAGGDA